MDYLHHTAKIVTAVDEFDYLDRIKPSAILQYFQDSATVHADRIGVGYEAMKEQNLCWVLNRLSAVIDRMPKLGEDIYITTYPHKPGLVDAVRDYHITDLNGVSLIRGTSRWCVLDIKTKSIRKCSPLFDYPDSVYDPNYTVAQGNPQLPFLSELSGEQSEYCGKVNITDLDRNGHMNNARYADIVVNSCDFDYYTTHNIRAFDFNFLSEMKIGDVYCVHGKHNNGITYFESFSNEKNRAVFRAAIKWDD